MAAGDPGHGSAATDQVPKSDFGLERWRLQHTADVKEVAEYWYTRSDTIWDHGDHEEVSGSLTPSHLSTEIAITLLARSFTSTPPGHVRRADPSPSPPLTLLACDLWPTLRAARRLTLAIPSNGEQNVSCGGTDSPFGSRLDEIARHGYKLELVCTNYSEPTLNSSWGSSRPQQAKSIGSSTRSSQS
jgi:hypothetical protein